MKVQKFKFNEMNTDETVKHDDTFFSSSGQSDVFITRFPHLFFEASALRPKSSALRQEIESNMEGLGAKKDGELTEVWKMNLLS